MDTKYHGIPYIPGGRNLSDDSMKKRQNSEKERQKGTHPDQQLDSMLDSPVDLMFLTDSSITESQTSNSHPLNDLDTNYNRNKLQPENIVGGGESAAHNSKVVSDMLQRHSPGREN